LLRLARHVREAGIVVGIVTSLSIFKLRVLRLSCEADAVGDCTAEARRTRSKEFLAKKLSDLCELRASVVKDLHTGCGTTKIQRRGI
jgi:hypothetical protein